MMKYQPLLFKPEGTDGRFKVYNEFVQLGQNDNQ